MLSLSLQAARRSVRSKSTHFSTRTARLTARTVSRPAAVALSSRQWYSTEKILKHRRRGLPESTGLSATADKLPVTLYDPSTERENCGVGLVASLKSIASRKVVEDADEMLVRMSHRGGVGCCPASGDGAGELPNVSLDFYALLVCLPTFICSLLSSFALFS